MTNNLQNEFKNFTLQQKYFILMGGDIKTQQKQVPAEVIKKMKKDYEYMYSGLSCINFGKGMTLGMASQKALEQMDAYVASKTKIPNHPLNNELHKKHAEFRRKIAERIMTSRYAEFKVEGAEAQWFLKFGQDRVKKRQKSLDRVYNDYMPKQQAKETSIAKSFEFAQNKTKQLMQQMLLQQTKQYAA